MSIQKLYRTGNSVVVTIPREYLSRLRLKEGSTVAVEVDTDADQMIIKKPAKSKSITSLTPEFKQWLDQTVKKHSKLILELAEK